MGSGNYKKWSRDMAFALQEAELWSYVTGARKMPREIPLPPNKPSEKEGDPPEESSETEEQLDKRDQRDLERLEFLEKQRRVVGKIGKMCTDDVQQEFLSMRDLANGAVWDPKDLWEHLKTRYTLKNWSAKWSTFNRLEEIKYEKCKSIEEYGSLVRNIKAEITDMALTVEQIVVLRLLNGLGNSFSTYLTILNEQARREDKFPALDALLKNLEDEEARMRQDPIATANVLKTKGKTNNKKHPSGAKSGEGKTKCKCCGKFHPGTCRYIDSKCKTCGKVGHLESVCEEGGHEASKPQIVCMIRECSGKSTQETPLICMAKPSQSPQRPQSLLLDSGATSHILCNKDFFLEGTFRSEYNFLETGSGEVLPTEGTGSLLIPLDNGNGSQTDLILTDVLYSPRLKFNLISTIKLGKKGIATYLMADEQPAQLVHKGKVIGLAKTIDNQYILETTVSPIGARALTTTNSAESPIQIWHERLGHLGYPNLLKLNHLANGVTIEGPIPEEVCGPCMMGRQQRKINRTPRTRATEFLGLVHSDLGGPFPLTRFGKRFYATIKDDFSGVVWVYLLKTKGQTFEIFKEFKAWIENQSGKKIKRLRADGGGEYTGGDFQNFLKKEGIQWEARAPNVPEQNGKAERQNYTLMVPTRFMLKAKRLPKSLWGEVLKTAGYIKNRSPGVDEVTPYERMNNAKPFLGHMRTVGARTWVHIPKEKRKKLDDRSWQGIFVGYDGNNQYRIYDPLTGKVHVCRDITVDEGNIYDPKDKKAWDLADIPWEKSDDGLFDDPDDFVENEVEIPNSLSPINPNSKISRSSEDQQVSAPSTPRIMLHPMGVNASGGGQAEESEGEDDPSETEEIPSPLIEPRRSGRLRVPSQKSLENSRPSINIFRSNQVPESHKHMVRVLITLARGEDTEGLDEPLTLKEAMSSPHWEQ